MMNCCQDCNLKTSFLHDILSLYFRPDPNLKYIDHIVGNMPDKEMEQTVQWYLDIQIA